MQRLIYVPPDGDTWLADIVIVGEAPGADEERERRPFVGRSGRLLREALTRAGLPWERVLITNVVNVRPEGNRTPDTDEIESWLPHLELQVANRAAILAVGKTAQKALDQLGGVLQYTSVYHPAYILRNGIHRQNWEEQLNAWVRSLPERGYTVPDNWGHPQSLPLPGDEGSTATGSPGDSTPLE